MTFPSVVSDLLMFAPSLSRWPVAPVEFALSDPAKSTKLMHGRHMSNRQGHLGDKTCKKKATPDSGYLFCIHVRFYVMSLHSQKESEDCMRTG